ncbi:MAG TPA: hypothetical protein VLX90_22115 [Steroidobacteraceae bacterium]|nr:hypothetical protein [Steroidobacteraceae bacterium]
MSTAMARPAAERRFYVGSALGIVAVVLAGFSIDLDLLRDMSSLSLLVRIHGLVMFGWIALFVAQTVLVARHRIAWHRRLGIFGAALAAAIVVADTATVIVAFRLGGNHLPPGLPAPQFLADAFFDLLTFAILVSSGIALRARSPWHKRFMLLAALMVLDAALARFISAYTSWGLDPGIARDVLVLACVAVDTLRYRRLHPAFILGGLLVFVTDPVADRAASLPAWAHFCAWLA